jgi:hypothetical protein
MSALSDAASIGGPVARGLLYIKSEKKENGEGRSGERDKSGRAPRRRYPATHVP